MNCEIGAAKSNYRKIGDYIRQVNERNTNGRIALLLGVNLDKQFMPSVANIIGVDLSVYKIIKKGQFGCKLMSVGRDKKVPISRLTKFDEAIISSAYFVFEVADENTLNPEYLMMWFSRPESDRYQWFQSGGDIRGRITWDEFCELPIKVPSIQKQREIVKEYNTVVNRIQLNEQLNQKLEETAQAIYKQWFVDFEFPNEDGKPFKSSGGTMVWNDELDKEIPEGWEVYKYSQIAKYTNERIQLKELSESNYISTENMLPNKAGVSDSRGVPIGNLITKFTFGDILLSNIRPYLKKIWLVDKIGGCSNDVLCISPIGVPSLYLYFVSEQDIFFDYIMAGAKGTKMPRGDKDWIMNYLLAVPKNEVIKEFTINSEYIFNRIKLNRKENTILLDVKDLLHSKMTKEGNN